MILHIDMDAFYASVEEREQPALRGQPLIVGGSPQGRGVVSAANYAARKFGVHSAMPTSQAIRLCPQAKIVRPRMSFYAEVSKQIHEIFYRFTPEIESLSLDEAFLNVAGCIDLFASAASIGEQIKLAILEELQLVASVGVAPNKFLAKLASDLEKPNGFTVVPADDVQGFLDPLSISRIWGVGKVTQQRFEERGVHTFEQLRKLGKEQVRLLFGSHGEHFWRLSQGIDHRFVVAERKAKSVSHETTFAADVMDVDVLSARMLELTEQVAARLRHRNARGSTVSIKLRYSDFHTITRSETLEQPTHATDRLWEVTARLLENSYRTRNQAMRLIGMGVSNLKSAQAVQLELFQEDAKSEVDLQKLDHATDTIRAAFGSGAIRRGSTVKKKTSN